MQIITVINAKGGCGKSTIAMSVASGLALRGHKTLLIDMDPQAQVTQWLGLGDGLSPQGTLVAAMEGTQSIDSVVQQTAFENLSFIASSQQLEDLGRQITDREDYASVFTGLMATLNAPVEFVVIDSPNQISPVMENAIYPSDAFIVPFESTKAVRSYANFFQLLMRLRPGEEHRVLHVLSNLSRQRGLRQRVIDATGLHHIALARTEIHTCGWLAQVDESGGNIFAYRPHSRGAEDMALLVQEVLELLGHSEPALASSITPVAGGSIERAESPARETYGKLPNDAFEPSSVAGHGNTSFANGDDARDSIATTDIGGLSDNRTTQHEAA